MTRRGLPLRIFERLYVMATILICAGALSLVFSVDEDSFGMTESNASRMLVILMFYLVAVIALALRYPVAFLHLVKSAWPLVLLLAYILLSCLWSDFPGASLRRALALILTTLFTAYVVLRFRDEEIHSILAWSFLLFVVFNIAFILAFPDIGMLNEGAKVNRWSGVLGSNTRFGRDMALAAIVFLALLGRPGPWRHLAWVGLGLSGVGLLGAQAATSWVAFAAVLFAWPFVAGNRRSALTPGVRLLLGGFIALLVGTFVIFNFTALLDILGRDPTLTHRTDIWALAIDEAMKEHPIIGSGYKAFWTENRTVNVFFNLYGSYNTAFSNSHSGYLDIWLELGTVGAGLFLLLVGSMALRFYSGLSQRRGSFDVFSMLLLVFTIVYSIAEYGLLWHTEASWALLMISYLASSRHLAARRLGSRTTQRPAVQTVQTA